MKNIVLVEADTISSGSTGRCGGGIRAQWSTPENVRLAMASVERFKSLESELETDLEFEQGGYLILAHSNQELKQFENNVKMQRSLNLDVELIDSQQAKEIVQRGPDPIPPKGSQKDPDGTHFESKRCTVSIADTLEPKYLILQIRFACRQCYPAYFLAQCQTIAISRHRCTKGLSL